MDLIKCPECGREIYDKVKSCPHCGYPMGKKIVCSECNIEYLVSEKSCPNCGCPNKKRINAIIMIVSILLVIALCLGVFLITKRNYATYKEETVNSEVLKTKSDFSRVDLIEEAALIEHTPEELKEELGNTSVLSVEPVNISGVNVDDIIEFGSYEQDNSKSNGSEAIEWYVIDIENDYVILMSVYALDCKNYNDANESVTWETCSLRTWLNNDFYNEAFNADEHMYILVIYPYPFTSRTINSKWKKYQKVHYN